MRFIVAVLLSLLVPAASAQSVPAPELTAKSWILIDYTTGQALAANEPDERIEPASLTKLMTAYLAFAALKNNSVTMDQQVPVSEKAWKQIGSRMFIEPRIPVTVNELLHGVIVQSGNDACVALAELLAGSEEGFAVLMNREAERLGMTQTHFVNSTGLPDEQHYTTARDLAILARAIVRDFPEYYGMYSVKDYTYNNITQANRNRLLWQDATVDGIKTGHTNAAGYCLISSAKRGERRLVSVVLGTESENVRAQESLKLLNYGFRFFDTVKIYSGGQIISQFRVWKGKSNEVRVGFLDDFIMSLPKDQGNKLVAALESQQPIMAPIQKGQRIGTLKLSFDGQSVGEYPVVALHEIAEAGFFGRLWDSLVLWFKSLF